MFIINIFLVIYLLNNITCNPTNEHDHWFGSKQLDNNYLFKWKHNQTNKVLTIRIEVKTKGWVAFGFSSHGLMSESDLVIGWVTDGGQTIFNDYWINKYETLSIDKSQDWFLTFSSENETHTTLEFYRKYKTCDHLTDLEVYENIIEESNIMWAYSHQDPDSTETIPINQNKGLDYINLFEQEPPLLKGADIQIMDYWMKNLSLSSNTTQVLCQFIKTNLTKKIQIIKLQSVFVPSNLNMNHHSALTLCAIDADLELINKNLGKLFPCYPQKPNPLSIASGKCKRPFVGSSFLSNEALNMPDNAGVTMDPNDMAYIIMEAHFENHGTESITDYSFGLRTWTTSTLREHDEHKRTLMYFYSIVVSVVQFLTITQLLMSIIIIRLLYKTYQFWTYDRHFYDIDYQVFKDDQSLTDTTGIFTQTFPNSWYAVLRSEEVLPGEVKPIYVLKRNLVVFRTTTGKTHVLDAFCPHLGANIGVGGSVVGEDIRCPFHSWTFNGDGICTSVPGLEVSNIPKAKLKRWDCVERNKWVYIWYHDQNAKPTWMPKDYQELKNSQYCCQYAEYVRSHFLSWYINLFDKAHFKILHQLSGVMEDRQVLEKTKFYYFFSKIFRIEFEFKDDELNCQKISEPPCSRFVFHIVLILFGYPLESFRVVFVGILYPPDYFFEVSVPRFGAKIYMLLSSVFIAPRKWKLTYEFYNSNNTIRSLILAKIAVNFFYQFGGTDKIVMSNQKTAKKPGFTKLDRCLAKFYKWLIDNYFRSKDPETIN